MTDSGTQENTMKLGGGTANGMRALGYQVLPPNTDSTCWRMITPQGPHTEHLAADEAEGWCKAEQHWQASSVYNALRHTPAPVSGDMREVVARAMHKHTDLRLDWMLQCADAVLPIIAAEIAAAVANERARIAMLLEALGDISKAAMFAKALCDDDDREPWQMIADRARKAIDTYLERNEHGAGK